jgi:hypothetical protein
VSRMVVCKRYCDQALFRRDDPFEALDFHVIVLLLLVSLSHEIRLCDAAFLSMALIMNTPAGMAIEI